MRVTGDASHDIRLAAKGYKPSLAAGKCSHIADTADLPPRPMLESMNLPIAARTRLLRDGNEIPLLGLAVWQVPDGPECVDTVRWALEAGYRQIGTAQAYGNELSVGRGIRASGLPREQLFVTTKFLPRHSEPVAAAEMRLRRLGIEQLDLYLVHWPQSGATRAWDGMECARQRGLTRSIGVSNFSATELEAVVAAGKTGPVVNQIELNPQHYRRAQLDACIRHDVAVKAHSPLGTGRSLADPVVAHVARQVGRSPAQVLLRWCLQRSPWCIRAVRPDHRNRQSIAAHTMPLQHSLGDGCGSMRRIGYGQLRGARLPEQNPTKGKGFPQCP